MSKRNFRIITIAFSVLLLMPVGYEIVCPGDVVENVNSYIIEIEPELSHLENNVLMFSLSLATVMVIVSLIGLFMFKSWARHLFVLSNIVIFPIYLIGGLYVYSGLAQAICDLSLIVEGFIIALVYFSPLKGYFIKPKI